MNVTEDTKKLGTEVSFNLHLPLFFHSPLQRFYSLWGVPFTRWRSTACYISMPKTWRVES